MKTAAIVLMVLALLVGVCLCYGLYHTQLQVAGKGLEVLPALERLSQFDALKTAVQEQSLQGTVIRNAPLGSAENYTYYIYSLRLKNLGLVPAEMVEMQIGPTDNDILFYGDSQEIVIPPGQSKDVWCVLLTDGTPNALRDIYVTYYLWGHPQEMRYTYDPMR